MNPKRNLKIGITGQNGFIGTHLINFFRLKLDIVTIIPFEDDYFNELIKLQDFVKQCDVIIHLAALNRHNDPLQLYKVNIQLIDKLIEALETTQSTPHVIFASSTQEERDNKFGQSKREGRTKFSKWANKNGASFTGLIIPNVYGPFGKPHYNSVIATFCHQASRGEPSSIDIDADLKLIYVFELIDIIWKIIGDHIEKDEFRVPHTCEKKVSEIKRIIDGFATQYLHQGIIPEVHDSFEYNLFNSFLNYNELQSFYPVKYKQNMDERGSFVELLKTVRGGQVSFSTTKPGVIRGNHYHTRKIERFSVVKGKAIIRLRRIGTNEILEFNLDGNEPSYVDIPVWNTHNIINQGNDELLTIFWTNEFYNSNDPDTYFETV